MEDCAVGHDGGDEGYYFRIIIEQICPPFPSDKQHQSEVSMFTRKGEYPLTKPILELTAIPTLDAVLAASSSVAPNKFPTRVDTATDTANLHQSLQYR